MKKFLTKKALVATSTAFGVLAAGIGAYASFNWTSSGSGNGAVTTYTQTATVSDGTGSADSGLYPGGAGGALKLGVGNTNPYQVTITAVSLGTPVVDGGAVTDCALSTANSLTGASLSGAGGTNLTLASTDSSDTLTLPKGDLTMGSGAGNDCQGKAITVPVTVTFTQSGS